VVHEINRRADTAPVNVRPYRLPERHKTEVNWQTQEMLKNKIIRTSVNGTSQWNAPLLVVPRRPTRPETPSSSKFPEAE